MEPHVPWGKIVLKSRVAVSLGGLIACVIAVALVVIGIGQSPQPHFATVDSAKLPVAADAKRATTTHPSAPSAKPSEAADTPEAAPDADREPKFAPHQIIVRYNKSATSAERAAARRVVGGKKAKSLPLDAELLTLPKGVKVMSAKRALAAQSAVRSAMPDMVTHSTQSSNDPYFGLEWGLQNTGQNGGIPTDDISATSAWNTSTGSDQVIVAVIDTGVDYNHPDLANNMWENSGEPDELDGNGQNKRSNGVDDDNNGLKDDWRGWDFNNGDNDPIDDNMHGTHVAGTIGAEGNNGEGISGVGWNTKVMNLKASDSSGSGSMSSAIAAMGYAASKGARVVNGSFGYETYGDYSWESDLIAAYPNTLFVFAAGNSHIDNDGAFRGYPCSHAAPNVVCVAASDSSDNKAGFSNYGKTSVDLAAPGVGILSTKASVLSSVTGNYIYLNGTSMATPHVAGAAAVLLAAHPSATTADLKEALVSGADPVPAFRNKVVSDGRLNLQGSLDALDTKLNSQGTTVRFGGNRDIHYNAAVGETNNVTVTQDANHIDFTDPGNAISTGPGCYSVAGDHVRCNRSLTDSIKISTGDGDDSVQSAVDVPVSVELGDGDDTATTGDGDDTLNGGPGADTMSGGAGDDTVDYSGRSEDLNISLDNDDNDGTPTESDDINANVENAIGGNGADTITAGNAAATLSGGPGDDIITGSDFNDVLKDGPGADQLIGGAGDDQLFGTAGDGDDVLSAGTGTDVANYNETPYPNGNMPDLSIDGVANDGLLEEQDNVGLDVENLIGSDYGDILNGSDDANVLSGGGGYDSINGRGGDDDLQGDVGADTLDGGPGEDVISGGSENDTVNYSTSTEDLQISLDGQANDGLPSEPDFIKEDVENVFGGQGDDTITGSPVNNRFEGGAGDDSIDGGDGVDVVIGGGDSDLLAGGAGFDYVEYPGRSEHLELSIDGQANDGAIDEGDDIRDDVEYVTGGYGDDELTGGDNTDFLDGDQGDDTFFGGDGDDTFIGDAGNDVFHGEAGSDRVSYEGHSEGVTVTLDGQANDGKPGETDLVGADVENLWGTLHDDNFTGDDNANILTGIFGSDTIHGGDGNDEIDGYGWVGDDDHLFGDAGDDEVVGGTMQKIQDPVWRFAGPLYGTSDIHGGTGNDKLYGSADGSEIFGDEGDDLIQGWFATDQIAGGDGSDTVSYHYTYGPVNVSLDGAANDGMANENDAIAGDVENAIGSWGKDTVTGNEGDNELLGHRGDDTVSGFGGNDVLNGGVGTDVLNAGDGDDLITSIDEYVDTVDCGAGTDAVVGDANETLSADCEQSGLAARVEFKHEYSDADVLEFRAVAGVANNVSVVRSGTTYTFSDSGGALLAGRGCTQSGANSVECADLNQNAYQIDIQTRDGNDTIDVDSSVKIYTDLDGGTDDDLLLGGGGMDYLYGGWSGDDELYGRGGEDIADYREFGLPVTISANDIADDGAAGETDNVHSDIEELAGGYGNDTLYGSDTGVLLYGHYGNDKLISGLGDDLMIGAEDFDTVSYENRSVPIKISQSNILPKWYLFASDREKFRSGQSGEADGIATDVERIVGGSAADAADCHLSREVAIDGGPGADEITNCDTVDYGSRTESVNVSFDGIADEGENDENDILHAGVVNAIGGEGNDTFSSDRNENSFTGGAGDDQFVANDTSADAVECGSGDDSVVVDGLDTVDSSCESITGAAVVYRSGSRIVYSTSGNVTNSVGIAGDNNLITITDTGSPVQTGYGCESVSTNVVACNATGVVAINASTDDGDDSIINGTSIAINVRGGAGNDFMQSGDANDSFDGGAGIDTVSYENRSASILGDADDDADDGGSGENDNIIETVENITGGGGDDTISGNNLVNSLDGGDGDDTISSVDAALDSVLCGPGTDVANLDGVDTTDGNCENIVLTSAMVANGTLYFWAAPGIANEVDVVDSGDDYLITDPAGLTEPGDGCVPITTNEVLCDGTDVQAMSLDARDGDDTLHASVDVSVPVAFSGGIGSDTVSYADQTEDVNIDIDSYSYDGAAGDGDFVERDVENLVGGLGDDFLYGSDADNTFFTSPGSDTFHPRAGADTVSYESRSDNLSVTIDGVASDGGASENDLVGYDVEQLIGGAGDDTLTAGNFGVTMRGNQGADVLAGGSSEDVIYGGFGNDLLAPGDDDLSAANDMLDGGDGIDTADYSARDVTQLEISLDDVANDGKFDGETDNVKANIESIIGGGSSDTLVGNDGPNSITGGSGNDSIEGLGGDDSIESVDAMADAVFCGSGIDNANVDGNDATDGNCENVLSTSIWIGQDTLYYSAQSGVPNEVDVALLGEDYLITDPVGLTNPGAGCAPVTSIQVLCVGAGVDAISLDTRDGNDSLHASATVEQPVTFTGGSGVDTVSYADQTLPLQLNLDDLANDGATNDHDSIEADVENLIGGSGDDYHYGSSADNTFFSSPGADYFIPRSGTDTVSYEGRGEDLTMSINGSADDGATGEHDNIGAEVERMIGGDGADAISVGYSSWSSDANELIGGPGNDTMDPGTGLDTVDGGTGDDQITTSDGQYDAVTCGDGDDYLQPDNGDAFGADCEDIFAPSYVYYSPDPQYGDLLLDTGYWDVNNDFTITKTAGEIVIHDSTQAVLVDQSTGCTAVDGNTVSCPDVDIATIHVADATGNDSYTADPTVTRPITFTSEAGDDTFTGGNGNDRLHGTNDDGDDTFIGGNGTDTIDYSYKYQSVNVSLDGERNDGGIGENDLIANDVENAVGSYANDIIIGSDGNNSLSGYYGNDVIDGKLGADSVLGGNGVDTVTYADRTSNLTVTQDNTGNDGDGSITENDNVRNDVESVEGGSGDDTITTGTIANTVRGNGGNDVLNGGTGADTVYGDGGNDTLVPGDTDSSSSNDTLDGGADVDTANYSARATTQLKLSLDDVANDGKYTGETDNVKSNVENIVGGGNADTLEGSDLPNTIDGGDGHDTIDGKLEADVINGGNGTDTANYSSRTARVEVSADGAAFDGETDEQDNVATDIENITGGSGPDFLVGNASDNILSGGLDSDVLMGGPSMTAGSDGDDTFNGGSGFDYVTYSQRPDDLQLSIGGASDGASGEADNITASIEAIQAGFGNDTLTGDMYANTLEGSIGDDLVTSGDGNDVVSGGPGANTLDGGAGNDDIVGGDDADTIHGGDGDDTISGGAGNDTLDGELGFDISVGDTGDDNIESRDGQIDENYCDDGNDTAHGDMWDVIDNCETSTNGPDTTIDSPADGTVFNTSSPAFTFSSNESPPTFECMIDGAAIGPCFSGDPLPAVIEDGPHTIEVVAYDQWGNYDQSPPARSFVVDTQGPTVDVTAPTGVIANTITPTIAFSATDASGVTGTTCSMDGETPIACASGMTWPTSLAQGVHTLTVSATDGVGNVGTGASQFTIDTTPPETIIDSGPSGYTNQSSPTFTFHGTPAEAVAEYECSLDGANYGTCVSPKQYVGLSQGPHTVDVRAKNFAGVIDATPAHHDFTVDNVQPAVTIASPTGLQTTATPVVTFSVADASPVNSTCSLDYVALPSCTDGMTLSSLANGAHNFAVSSEDAAANTGSAYVTFVVDTTTPDVSVSGSTLTIDTTTTSSADGRNGIAVSKSGSVYTINGSISPSLTAGAGCTNVTAVQVTCDDMGITALNATLGDGNDNYSGGNVTVPGTISGGNGNDSLAGGTANETIVGGDGGDYMSGGGGTDTLSYADHSASITASLDGNLDNGSPGEGDSTQPDVENIIGGSGDDLLRSNSGNNSLAGGGGSDTVTFAGLSAAINANLLMGVATGAGSDTFTSIENLTGGTGTDTLTGDGNSNVIDAGSGSANDTINGGGGTDTVSYASANAGVTVNLTTTTAQNTVGAGTDTITNTESLTGSGFNDSLRGTTAANAFNGLAGTDTISYASGASSAVTANLSTGVASGGSGADTFAGVENLTGSSYADNLQGDAGDNVINGGTGTTSGDVLNGNGHGSGGDTVDYTGITSAVTVNLATTTSQSTGGAGYDTITNMENATGGSGGDTLTGTTGNNTINGAGGTDRANYSTSTAAVNVNLSLATPQNTGGAGTDTLLNNENVTGGSGGDTLAGTTGNNSIIGGSGTDTVSYAAITGNVTLNLGTTSAQNTVSAGSDTISSIENSIGGSGNDTLTGSTGNNTITGGPGNDVINASSGTDTVSYESATAGVTVNLATTSQQNTVGAGLDTITNTENLTGSNYNDTLSGSTGDNVINALLGIDTVSANSGNDTITVKDGLNDNTTTCGSGTDTVSADVSGIGDATAADCETVNRSS